MLNHKQEDTEQAADLPDDDPKMVARLLLFLYTRRYPVRGTEEWQELDNEHYYAHRKQLASVIGCNDNEDEIPRISLCVEATVHGLAEKYVVPRLKKLSIEAYQASAKIKVWSPQTIEQFTRSIKIVYSTTKPSDQLRDFVIWKTQIKYLTKPYFNAFQELFTSNGDFAWDLVTRCKSKTWVWCKVCEASVMLFQRDCMCGMMGFCQQSAVCGKWEDLMCTTCHTIGQCQSQPPISKQPAEVQGISRTENSD